MSDHDPTNDNQPAIDFVVTTGGVVLPFPAPKKEATKRKKKHRRGSEKRKTQDQILSRYTPDEYKSVAEAASRVGLTAAAYQRQQTLTTPPKMRAVRRPPVERELLTKTLGQLGHVGGNLNQVAHAANIDRVTNREVMAVIADLRDLLPLVAQALGRKP
jgi:hypothetical protein